MESVVNPEDIMIGDTVRCITRHNTSDEVSTHEGVVVRLTFGCIEFESNVGYYGPEYPRRTWVLVNRPEPTYVKGGIYNLTNGRGGYYLYWPILEFEDTPWVYVYLGTRSSFPNGTFTRVAVPSEVALDIREA